MRTYSRNRLRLIALVVPVAALIGSGFAFTASNTVTAKDAGNGADTISGYTINSVSYTLNSTNPGNIDAVKFVVKDAAGAALAANPSTVKIKLVSSGSDWFACSLDTGTTTPTDDWSCATTSPQATVVAADELRVVAAE